MKVFLFAEEHAEEKLGGRVIGVKVETRSEGSEQARPCT